MFWEKVWEKITHVKENIFRWINRLYWTPEKIFNVLYENVYKHIDRDNNGITVSVEFAEYFSQDLLENLEKNEKGSTDTEGVVGITGTFKYNDIGILYSLEAIDKVILNSNPFTIKKLLIEYAKHEAFHCKQYIYVLQHGGEDALEKISKYIRTIPYEFNVLEMGAVLYQCYDTIQDFDRTLVPIINEEYDNDELLEITILG